MNPTGPIDIAKKESKQIQETLENEMVRLDKKMDRDTGFVNQSKKIISGIDRSMHELKGTMTKQVDDLKKDLKKHLIIEAAKAVVAACVAVVGAFWGNPPDTKAIEKASGIFLLKLNESNHWSI